MNARLLALVPIVVLVAIAALFVSSGGSITGLVGDNPPSADTFEVRRVEFPPGEVAAPEGLPGVARARRLGRCPAPRVQWPSSPQRRRGHSTTTFRP